MIVNSYRRNLDDTISAQLEVKFEVISFLQMSCFDLIVYIVAATIADLIVPASPI